MSLFDRALNAAADSVRATAAAQERARRRQAIVDQLMLAHQAVHWSTTRIGQLALDSGQPLPPAARPAADAVRSWQHELAGLQHRLAELDRG